MTIKTPKIDKPIHSFGPASAKDPWKKLKIPVEYGLLSLLHNLKVQVRLEVQDMGCPVHSQAPVHAKMHWLRLDRHINAYYSNPCKPGTFMRFKEISRFLKWLSPNLIQIVSLIIGFLATCGDTCGVSIWSWSLERRWRKAVCNFECRT